MTEQWEEELEELITSELISEIQKAQTEDQEYIEFDCDRLFEYSELPEKFFNEPETVLEEFENRLDSGLNVRPYNVPEDICNVSVGDLGVKHEGELVVLKGVLQTATDPKGRCQSAVFKCQRCGEENRVMQYFGEGIRKPKICQSPNCSKKGPFKFQEGDSDFVDYQFADIQEKPTEIEGSQQARSKLAYLEGSDLMDKIEPGQDVVLVGIPYLIQEKESGNRSNTFNIWIKALNIRVDEEEYYAKELSEGDRKEIERWKEKTENPAHSIICSLAPDIENSPKILYEVKKAVALQTVGCPKPKNVDRRSTINILLCGDPGVAKTRLAQKACDLRPRSQYASGARSSGPGLTASVVRDERTGDWLLKAGRLILASGAVLAIDDYEQMEDNKGQLLEAMSVEQVSISKVINRVLPAHTSVLALANPEYGRFQMNKDIHKQLPTEPAEHSRYDLIFAIQDEVSKERDSLVSDKIYSNWMGEQAEVEVLSEEKLKKIVAYARSLSPELPEKHKETLKKFYIKIRQRTQKEGKTPFTPRYVEAMIRLAIAHARLRLSEKVEEEDIKEAVSLVKASLSSLGFDLNRKGANKIEALETGMTRDQKEKINALWNVLEDLNDIYDKKIPVRELKEEAESEGIGSDFVSEFIDREIHEKGNISWADEENLRVVNSKW